MGICIVVWRKHSDHLNSIEIKWLQSELQYVCVQNWVVRNIGESIHPFVRPSFYCSIVPSIFYSIVSIVSIVLLKLVFLKPFFQNFGILTNFAFIVQFPFIIILLNWNLKGILNSVLNSTQPLYKVGLGFRRPVWFLPCDMSMPSTSIARRDIDFKVLCRAGLD